MLIIASGKLTLATLSGMSCTVSALLHTLTLSRQVCLKGSIAIKYKLSISIITVMSGLVK